MNNWRRPARSMQGICSAGLFGDFQKIALQFSGIKKWRVNNE
jgi:hypothetical protein